MKSSRSHGVRITEAVNESLETKPEVFSVALRWVTSGDLRLDAFYHGNEAAAVKRIIEESDFPIMLLGDPRIAKQVFVLGRFKRVYTSCSEKGWPYLSASETFLFRPKSERYIAQKSAPKDALRHFAKKGQILVSCSGVVGRCVLATERLEKYFLTHDLIRIEPGMLTGYLYAFLASRFGKALMTREEYGSTISHMEPHHVLGLPIPLLPEDVQQRIHNRIEESYALRDEANNLLDAAEQMLYEALSLPSLESSTTEMLATSDDNVRPLAFTVHRCELQGRLDASFHLPEARAAIVTLKRGKHEVLPLGDKRIASHISIPPRFKRVYVEKEHGIPFLQSSHLPLIRPYDLKFLSRSAHKDLSPWVIHEGEILVSCSGTIGRVSLTTKALDGWAASQHIARIVPNVANVDAGFLALFLMTPLAQQQLASKIYGAVVDELTEQDTAEIMIPVPPMDEIQKPIGCLVTEAFEKREKANSIERNTIKELERMIHSGKKSEIN